MVIPNPCSEKEKAELVKRAAAMHAHLVFGKATQKDRDKAEDLWKLNKKRAAWGCLWFALWLKRVKEAVEDEQRLKVVFFPDQVGCGKVPWKMLATENLWNGVGCGGSQKGEVAKLDQMRFKDPRWQYDEVDVTMFLSEQFPKDHTVDALYPDAPPNSTNRFRKASILQVPHKEMEELTWTVKCQKTGVEFETKLVRHTTDFFENLLRKCGEDVLKSILETATNLRVGSIAEERLPSGTISLAVKIDMARIEDAHQLRDAVLSGDMAVALNRYLEDQHQVTEELSADKTDFLDSYSRGLMSFSKLTEHQEEKLKELSKHPDEDVHLRAPAGAGKTFVALRYVLEIIKKLEVERSKQGHIMYLCPHRALIYHFVQWLLIHAEMVLPGVPKNKILQRVVVMHSSDNKPMSVRIQGSRIVLEELATELGGCLLAVFDEGHDLFRTESSVFRRINGRRKLILSDISQSSTLHNEYPELRQVILTQVVRSTKRVVLGASTFQLQDHMQDADTTCLGTDGPPLKSFLFEAPEDDPVKFRLFAEKTLQAIWHIARAHPSVCLQQHIAIIVPNEDFYVNFKPCVMKRLEEDFFPFCKVISFEEALCHIPDNIHKGVATDSFILDWDCNAKGLEKLFVICVGFDSRINKGEVGEGSNFKRAQLYHSITRAQFQALIVDRVVRGGWLEFLSTLKLKEDTFDESTAALEVRKNAAREIVKDTWLSNGD
eukprot:Skav214606  [mRNA]  locus=scaffold57:982173:984323:- [translate_table: standard]